MTLRVEKPFGINAVNALANMLVQDHVFPKLDSRLQSLTALYQLLRDTEDDKRFVLACYDDDKFCGVFFLEMVSPEDCVTHIAFHRHTNPSRFARLAEIEVKRYNPTAKRVIGYISTKAKAALFFAAQCGYLNLGTDSDYNFIDQNGNIQECYKISKEI